MNILGIITGHYSKIGGNFPIHGGWIRISGKGFSFKDINIHGLTFSQRNNHSKYLKIGKWVITYLK